jgi:Domain of unknown function (DUF1906)
MNTRSALVREVGFDTLDATGAATNAAKLQLTGLAFAMIYVERATRAIVQQLLANRVDVCFLSEARIEGWSRSTGTQDGQRAAAAMLSLGVPGHVSLGCDMEAGVPDEPTAVDYANAWYSAAVKEGLGIDAPDLYVGAGSGFVSADSLYHQINFRRYHRSGSIVPNVSVRNYCCYQLTPFDQVLMGVQIDFNVMQVDDMGGTLTLLTL